MEQEYIATLTEALKSPNELERDSAAYNLALIGKRAVLPILQLLEDINLNLVLRIKIIELLQFFIADKIVVDALLKISLTEQDLEVKAIAIVVLGYSKREDIFNFLMKTVEEETYRLQLAAITALGYTQDQRAIKTLAKFLTDKDIKLKLWAVNALGKIGGDEAINLLIKTLETDDYYLQYNIIIALGELGSIRSLPILEAIKDKEITDPIAIFDGPSFTEALNIAIQTIKMYSSIPDLYS